jgi:hypothetical protein
MTSTTRVRLSILVLLAVGAAAFLAGWGVVWLVRGSYPTAIVIFAGVPYLLGFALHMAYVVWDTPRPRSHYGPEGTVIRPPKWADRMFYMSFIFAVLGAALYLCFLPLGMIDVHLPDGYRRVDIAICVFLIAFGAPTLFRAFRHGGESHLLLDPEGFEVWNGFWGSFVRGRWDDVEQIQDHPLRGRKTGREVLVIGRRRGRTATFMSDAVTDDSDALLEWVRFYWQHPEYRSELVDERGLRRLSGEEITTD